MHPTTILVGKALMLSCLCFGIARASPKPTLYDADSYQSLSWLRPPAQHNNKPIVLSEDPHEQQATFPLDQSTFTRTDRSLLPEYRHLCETATRKVQLDSDPIYEYQPPHYFEIFCKSYSLVENQSEQKTEPAAKQKCAHPSFHCIQRTRTLFMLRRRWDAECWEPSTRVVASGCDCMWPTSNLGDVSIHY